MAPRPNISLLRRDLDRAMIASDSGLHFIPTASLEPIFNMRSIEDALLELDCQPDDRIGLTDEIYDKGKLTFAILILMREEERIILFRQHGCLDSRLPLSKVDVERIDADIALSFADQYQWRVLPRYLPQNMWEHHQVYRDQEIMPFVGDPEYVTEGGFGEIHKIKVITSQQAFFPSNGFHVEVIRKKLKRKDITKAVQHERMCLRLLNNLQHPNIIRLLGSYTHRGEQSFLFPCIEMDLSNFFQRNDRFGEFKHDFSFFSALRGLSSALAQTHRLHLNQARHGVDFEAIGYHHDFRPKNVLVSRDTFILADLGFGNLKTVEEWSATPWKPTTGDYIAPECMDDNFMSQSVSRAIDVWAFACLIAETITFIKAGSRGIEDFRKNRLSPGRAPGWSDSGFYQTDGSVKEVVSDWLRHYINDDTSDPICSLAGLCLGILLRDPDRRPNMTYVCNRLTALSLRAHFLTIQNRFIDVQSKLHHSQPRMSNTWFSLQRFGAWGTTLGLDTEDTSSHMENVSIQIYTEAITTMLNIFQKIDNELGHSSADDSIAWFAIESEVDQLIEKLWGLLPGNDQERAVDCWHQNILATDSVEDLDHVHHKLKARYTANDMASAMALMKKFHLKSLHPDTIQSKEEPGRIEPSEIKFTPKPNESDHQFAQLHNRRVLVETLNVNSKDVSSQQRALVLYLMSKSLSIDGRPPGLRTLKCLGAIEEHPGDSKRDRFVYQFPGKVDSDPTTLLKCLVVGVDSQSSHPYLKDRFQLAFALTDFMKEFHTIGWLHKNFNSHNVLLFEFPADGTSITPKYQCPYVVGLHETRPDGSYWETTGSDAFLHDYRHPRYKNGTRFKQVFDYYSLGIVLLEVGLWCPLDRFLASPRFRRMGAEEISSALCGLAKNRLGSKMGRVYRDVVVSCLAFEEEAVAVTGPKAGREDVLRHFSRVVVEPLRGLATAPI
ncbi:kinase-like domain-containing protein [Fusarium flagelliforme]|uniref:kinase-like domain-containing protein n=1 Tax=Fusarium flagelliforme TaxID=2675880 RepID=UPI001E8E0D9D|nr:kinase-like domain-containing protein [Fusarium flagelliforme]KAH7198914.1 kinase-like domain-containing protein [Fusarium flagelliforme]